MARNAQTALYINDPVKIIGGFLSLAQGVYTVGIVGVTYALIKLTSRLPYGQSTMGQIHLLLVVGVPAGLGFLVMTFGASGTVEPYARQLLSYLARTTRRWPRVLTYRVSLLWGRHRDALAPLPTRMTRLGPVECGAVVAVTLAATETPAAAPYVAPLVTTMARPQRARLLDWLAAHPLSTDEEIAEGVGINPSSERPLRGELETLGLLRKVDEHGRTRSGRRAARWEVATHA